MSKQHHYLTLVANHRTGRIVWAGEGKSAATLDAFFDELGTERAHRLTAVSVDMSPQRSASPSAPTPTLRSATPRSTS